MLYKYIPQCITKATPFPFTMVTDYFFVFFTFISHYNLTGTIMHQIIKNFRSDSVIKKVRA